MRCTGTVLSLDLLPNGEAATLTAWVAGLGGRAGAEILVSDDADGFKTAADASGLLQQVCTAHVSATRRRGWRRSRPPWPADADGSLAAIGVAPGQAVADCQDLLRLMTRAPAHPGGERHPGRHPPPLPGAPPSRPRARPCRWPTGCACSAWTAGTCGARLTRYRTWEGPDGERLDGTNNACERAIGWWVKERYRSCAATSARSPCCTSAASSPPWATPSMVPASPSPRSSPERATGKGGDRPAAPSTKV